MKNKNLNLSYKPKYNKVQDYSKLRELTNTELILEVVRVNSLCRRMYLYL